MISRRLCHCGLARCQAQPLSLYMGAAVFKTTEAGTMPIFLWLDLMMRRLIQHSRELEAAALLEACAAGECCPYTCAQCTTGGEG